MATNYSKQTWVDNDASYPLSAARMGVMEDGIYDAHFRPTARVSHSTDQATGNGSYSTLSFNQEGATDFDSFAMHSTSSNTSRITVPQTGIYLVGAVVAFTASATGNRLLQALVNGTTVVSRVASSSTLSASVATYLELTVPVSLVAGNYVELQADGGTASINALAVAGVSPVFWVTMLSAA